MQSVRPALRGRRKAHGVPSAAFAAVNLSWGLGNRSCHSTMGKCSAHFLVALLFFVFATVDAGTTVWVPGMGFGSVSNVLRGYVGSVFILCFYISSLWSHL